MLNVREHGTHGRTVFVLHGGPGAPGSAGSLARRLGEQFRVLEPFQRGSGETPLTVAQHVTDLHGVVRQYSAGQRPVLVGHSWGAMLALAYATEHRGRAALLVLIACGTFDPAARAQLERNRALRTTETQRDLLARCTSEISDPDARLACWGRVIADIDSYAIGEDAIGMDACDARAHQETWDDMLRLQEEGVYPASFARIDVPVVMLHGADDPHPGAMIRASLEPHLRRLEYHEWPRCGHYPWLERYARDDCIRFLCSRLAQDVPRA